MKIHENSRSSPINIKSHNAKDSKNCTTSLLQKNVLIARSLNCYQWQLTISFCFKQNLFGSMYTIRYGKNKCLPI